MCRNLSLRNPTALDTLHNDDGDFSAFSQNAWPFRSPRYHDTNEEETFRLQDAKLGASTCLMSSLCPCLRPALPRASEQPRSREPVSPLLSHPLSSTADPPTAVRPHTEPGTILPGLPANTYQSAWARGTHTFSCHHNTEPTTSTTRAESSSGSSGGPLEARQRCSLEEAAAGRRERGGEGGRERGGGMGEGRGLGPGEWGRAGKGGKRTEGERGG